MFNQRRIVMSNEEYIKENPHQFKDELDKWLFKEFGIIGGACSSIGSIEYHIGRTVAEKLLNNLWKDAEGEDLPEIDREVIVLIQDFPQYPDSFKVGFGHRPDPDGWDAKSTTTEKIEHYTPKCYGKAGWNLPNIKYWLDVELPKEIEL